MIRFHITGQNPVEMNTAAKALTDHPRLEIEKDSGNRTGKSGYIRYLHAKILNKASKPKPKSRLNGTAVILAQRCWQKIVHQTDGDDEAVNAIIELIEYVERKCLND